MTLVVFNSMNLSWIKAHVGHILNEEADSLAKRGSGLEWRRSPQCLMPGVKDSNTSSSWINGV